MRLDPHRPDHTIRQRSLRSSFRDVFTRPGHLFTTSPGVDSPPPQVEPPTCALYLYRTCAAHKRTLLTRRPWLSALTTELADLLPVAHQMPETRAHGLATLHRGRQV